MRSQKGGETDKEILPERKNTKWPKRRNGSVLYKNDKQNEEAETTPFVLRKNYCKTNKPKALSTQWNKLERQCKGYASGSRKQKGKKLDWGLLYKMQTLKSNGGKGFWVF
jgi:hypothetical protein